jgi:hypothetical protein
MDKAEAGDLRKKVLKVASRASMLMGTDDGDIALRVYTRKFDF